MKRLAFFVGSDITSWLICHDVVSRIHSLAKVMIFFPKHSVITKSTCKELTSLAAYERTVLTEVIFPLLNNLQEIPGSYGTPALLCKNTCVHNVVVEDINDVAFSLFIRENFDGVISLRCYQKFSSSYVDHFRDSYILWNLHPGELPLYRGVMTCFRAMQNGETEHAFTLHQMDAGWDSGDIIAKGFVPLDLQRSFLGNMLSLYPSGVALLVDNLTRYLGGEALHLTPQVAGRYWRFPNQEELLSSLRKGLMLVNHEEAREWYRRLFFSDASPRQSQAFSDAFDSHVLTT